MKNNYELDQLNLESQQAFKRKQELWERQEAAKNAVLIAKEKLELSWIVFHIIEERMENSYEKLKFYRKKYRESSEEYAEIKKKNSAKIQRLFITKNFDNENYIVDQVKILLEETKNAKLKTESFATDPINETFKKARSQFKKAKIAHTVSKSRLSHVRNERDRIKREFDAAQAEFLQKRAVFQQKLAEAKAAKHQKSQYHHVYVC